MVSLIGELVGTADRAAAMSILPALERAAPEQYQSELPLRKRGPRAQSSLL